MKKILLSTLFALVLVPAGFVGAHNSNKVSTHSDAGLASYVNCKTFEECPGFREALIEALQVLLQELLAAKLAEAGNTAVVDYSDFQDATYQVLSDGRLAGASVGAVPDVSQEIWNDFTDIAPEEYIKEYVSYLRVYYDEDDFSAAYVETDSNDFDKWGLGVNLSDSNSSSLRQRRNLIETLIHEFAHILTLNVDEVDTSVSERRCSSYYTDEGCTYENSYMNAFVQDFWDNDDFDNSEEIENERDDDQKDDIADEYFEDNEGDYVTPYATWHPAEDIAESFAYFVLQDKPQSDAEEADRKLQFFYEYPELVVMRSNIRANYQSLFNF